MRAISLILPTVASIVLASPHSLERGGHAGLAKRISSEPEALQKRGTFTNARFTWYPTDTGADACTGKNHQDSDWYVALNMPLFGYSGSGNGHCGQQIKITANGKSTVATIVDACATCYSNSDIDLTKGLFQFFNSNLGDGVFYGSWEFVDGNDDGNDGNNGGDSKPTTTPKATSTPKPSPHVTSTSTSTPKPSPTTSSTHHEEQPAPPPTTKKITSSTPRPAPTTTFTHTTSSTLKPSPKPTTTSTHQEPPKEPTTTTKQTFSHSSSHPHSSSTSSTSKEAEKTTTSHSKPATSSKSSTSTSSTTKPTTTSSSSTLSTTRTTSPTTTSSTTSSQPTTPVGNAGNDSNPVDPQGGISNNSPLADTSSASGRAISAAALVGGIALSVFLL